MLPAVSALSSPTSTQRLLDSARRHIIRYHGLADELDPPVLSRGLGSLVWDSDGNEYVDFVSGQICATVGHSHPAILAAIKEAGAKMIHANDFMLCDDAIALAERLAAVLPATLSKFVFKSTGSESNEAAIYMAKIHTGGYEVVAPQRSFHGMTSAPRGATYSYGHRGHGPAAPGQYAIPVPYPYRCPIRHCDGRCDCTCLDVGFDLYDTQSEGRPAAFIVEPILSAGGLIDPPLEWFERLHAKVRERGMLLIVDEAQTAPGRLGALFGFEQFGVVPDILTLSKCIGGGLPLSAVATSAEIEQDCFDKRFIMGSSHTNDPLPACVGLAVLDVIEREDLVAQAAEKGERLRRGLLELAERHELVGDVRGRGLLQGIELVRDRDTKEPAEDEGAVFNRACLDRGLIGNVVRMPGQLSICRVAPPLTITTDELDRGLHVFDEALTVATESMARPRPPRAAQAIADATPGCSCSEGSCCAESSDA
ncbi:MAG: hypothetical protein V7607_1715 [Solirubrobacteraceae bacterium]